MTFLLDTNVVSELRRPARAAPALVEWIGSRDDVDLFCSCVSILEIEIGILRVGRRDPVQGGILRSWMNDRVLPRFEGRIVQLDLTIALACAALHVPDPRPDRDAWIAATALVHDMTVVTRNTRDFAATGARVFNPWIAGTAGE